MLVLKTKHFSFSTPISQCTLLFKKEASIPESRNDSKKGSFCVYTDYWCLLFDRNLITRLSASGQNLWAEDTSIASTRQLLVVKKAHPFLLHSGWGSNDVPCWFTMATKESNLETLVRQGATYKQESLYTKSRIYLISISLHPFLHSLWEHGS